jgi:hypothetical protein
MKDRIVKCICSAVFLAIILLMSGAMAQAPDQGQVPNQQQAPVKEEKSKPKEFRKTFCAEGSAPQRFDMVGAINCNEVCNNVYQEYPCDLQQWLSEGWKVTSVAISSIEVQRDPCECKITGTESVLERNQ